MFVTLLMTSSAYSQSYEIDFAVVQSAPVNRDSLMVLTGFDEIDLGISSTSVPSSWSYMNCYYDDTKKTLSVAFESDVASWPSTWPDSVTGAIPDPFRQL